MMDSQTAAALVASKLAPAEIKAWLDTHDKEWTAALTHDFPLLVAMAVVSGITLEQLGTGYSIGYWRGRTEENRMEVD